MDFHAPSRFSEALVFAEAAHRGQVRKGSGVPYISHLLAVAALVMEHGGDEDQAIAALLHDAVEDQGGPAMAERIRNRFGDRVAEIVLACTDAAPEPGQEKAPWRERKDAYVAALPKKPQDALVVAAADKLHNATTILADFRAHGDDLWSRFKGGRDGTLWYYRAVTDGLARRLPGPLVDRLSETVATLEREAAR